MLQSMGSQRVRHNLATEQQFSSVQFSRSVMSNSFRPHESQHARPPCPSPTPEVHPDSRPSISDAIQPSHPLSSPSPPAPIPPRIRVFSNESALCMRWPKYWSFSFSVIPSKEIPGLISLESKGLSTVFSNTTVQKHQFSAFFTVQLSHPFMTTVKTIALTRRTFVGKVMSLLYNMLSRLVITFLPRSVF